MKIVVGGGSAVGLAASLALARSGHDVTLVEQDSLDDSENWTNSFERKRSVGQFLHAHAFLARGRKTLVEEAPDVYSELLAAGAMEIDICKRLPEERKDPDLTALAVRRPIIEWALTRAVKGEPRIEVRERSSLSGLEATNNRIPTVTGVRLGRESLNADLVVDAMGRNSPVRSWLEELGPRMPEVVSETPDRLVYGRYFRFLPGAPRPDAIAPIQFRRDLGYLGFVVFWEDNGVFGIPIYIRPSDRELRILRNEWAWMAAVQQMRTLKPLVDRAISEPISPITSMGGLRYSLRRLVVDGQPLVGGLVSIGDAFCHTSPIFAYGLSLGFDQAFSLPRLIDRNRDHEIAVAFHDRFYPEAEERFRLASQTDEARRRLERGEVIDFSTPAGDRRLFEAVILPKASLGDPDLFVKVMRRVNLLDRTEVLDSDEEAWWKAADLYDKRPKRRGQEPEGPSRDEILKILSATEQEAPKAISRAADLSVPTAT